MTNEKKMELIDSVFEIFHENGYWESDGDDYLPPIKVMRSCGTGFKVKFLYDWCDVAKVEISGCFDAFDANMVLSLRDLCEQIDIAQKIVKEMEIMARKERE